MVEPWNLAMAISAGVSCTASFLVIATYLIFADLRKLRFVELVFYISLNDFLASLGAGFGHASNYEECWFQSITTNYNYLSGAAWTTVVCYQIYVVISYNHIIQDLRIYHWFCWLFPAVVTVLPFITYNTYGNLDDDGIGWCFIVETQKSPYYGIVLWDILSFYLWLWTSIFIMIVFILYINYKIRQQNHPSSVLLSTIQKLYWYPIVFIVSWIIPTVSDIYNIYDSSKNSLNQSSKFGLNIVSSIVPIYQGFFLAIVFFSKNPLVRERWVMLFKSIYYDPSKSFSWGMSEANRGNSSYPGSSNNQNKNMTMPSFRDTYNRSSNGHETDTLEFTTRLTLESDYVSRDSNTHARTLSLEPISLPGSLSTVELASSIELSSSTSDKNSNPRESKHRSTHATDKDISSSPNLPQFSSPCGERDSESNTAPANHYPMPQSRSKSTHHGVRNSNDFFDRFRVSFKLSSYNKSTQGSDGIGSLYSSSPHSLSSPTTINILCNPNQMQNNGSHHHDYDNSNDIESNNIENNTNIALISEYGIGNSPIFGSSPVGPSSMSSDGSFLVATNPIHRNTTDS